MKKLNSKSIRQGQTIYLYLAYGAIPMFLYCNSEVDRAHRVTCDDVRRELKDKNRTYGISYSRRSAERKAKELKHYAGIS